MSTKCGFRVPGTFKTRQKLPNGDPKTVTKLRPCGKDPEVFLRVDYSDLGYCHKRSGKFFDIFGCCSEHAEILVTDVNLWGNGDWGNRKICGVRGTVKAVRRLDPSEVPDPKELALRESKSRVMSGIKNTIKRLMGQRNTEKLTPDDWRVVFEEAHDEFVVESVMES